MTSYGHPCCIICSTAAFPTANFITQKQTSVLKRQVSEKRGLVHDLVWEAFLQHRFGNGFSDSQLYRLEANIGFEKTRLWEKGLGARAPLETLFATSGRKLFFHALCLIAFKRASVLKRLASEKRGRCKIQFGNSFGTIGSEPVFPMPCAEGSHLDGFGGHTEKWFRIRGPSH